MKATVAVGVLSMVGSSYAFMGAPMVSKGVRASSSTQQASSTTMMAEMSKALPFMPRPEKLDGSMAGDVGFDPFGFSAVDDLGLDLYWFREAELKHCRLAMLAVAGILFCDQVGSFPGFPAGKSQMDVFWQVWAEKPTIIGFGLVSVAILEAIHGIAISQTRGTDRAPGDFGLDPFKCKGTAKWDKYALQEVKNGRLAMSAAAGLILQGCSTHQSGVDNLSGMFN